MSENQQTQGEEDDIDLMQFVITLWEKKIIILLIVSLFSGSSIWYALSLQPLYESKSIWLSNQSSDNGGQFSRLASIAGMNLGGGGSENYEMYYDEILTSPLLLNSLIFNKWRTKTEDSLSLIEILKMDTSAIVLKHKYLTKEIIINNTLCSYLSSLIFFENAGKTLSLTITSEDPVLSFEINKSLLQSLKTYSESEKSSKAKRERLFVEGRYSDFKKDLKFAEAKLKKFRENNLNVNSPNLMLAQQRLIREVEIFNQLVIEFRKQLELAKIEEIKKIPEFKIIKEPMIPLNKSKPNKKLIVLVVTSLGFVIGCFITLLFGWWQDKGKFLFFNQ